MEWLEKSGWMGMSLGLLRGARGGRAASLWCSSCTHGATGTGVLMPIGYANPVPDQPFYRYCYVDKDRAQALRPGEFVDEKILPGAVRADPLKYLPTTVYDARQEAPASLQVQGFQLYGHAVPLVLHEVHDEAAYDVWLQKELLPKVAEAVQNVVEGSYGRKVFAVHAIDCTHRAADGTGVKASITLSEAHGDFTPLSGAKRLQNEKVLFKRGDGAQIEPGADVIMVNAWQPMVETVFRKPLAVCDRRSVRPDDLVRKALYFRTPDGDREGEVFTLRGHEEQKWYYYPHMSNAECLIFLTWSPGDVAAGTTPHSSVDDPTDAEDLPARRSMEVRFAVKFCDQ